MNIVYYNYILVSMENYNVRKIFLVYNPFSGKKKGEKVFKQILPIFEESDISVIHKATEYSKHAIDIMKSKDLCFVDAIVVLGGDGTLNEVINGILERDDNFAIPPLGIVPCGTGNAFATDLGFYQDPIKAVKAIINGYILKVDCGLVNFKNLNGFMENRYMLNLVGLGLAVDSNIRAERMRFWGPMRYNVSILLEIFNIKKKEYTVDINIDNVEEILQQKCSVIMIQNTKHGGDKLILAPNAKIDDGYLDIIYAPKYGRYKMFKLFKKVLDNGSHVTDPNVVSQKFKSLIIKSNKKMNITIDGENCGTTPINVTVKPQLLKFFNHISNIETK